MVTNTDLIENLEVRNNLIGHLEVLERVKTLLLIKNIDMATTQQVADFYEVDREVIKKVLQRHREELLDDGIMIMQGKQIKEKLIREINSPTTNIQSGFIFDNVKFANGKNTLFPKRAILRIGMLLRDSKVAKEIRTQLLNIGEKASPSIKIQDINEEQQLACQIGLAMVSGEMNRVIEAMTNYTAFKNRHIEQLEQANTQLETTNNKLSIDNKALTESILEWEDRKKLNAGVRKLASTTQISFPNIWNELYRNLQYKYGICLKSRGKAPYISHAKEDEWSKIIQTFSALCEIYNQSPSEMIGNSLNK